VETVFLQLLIPSLLPIFNDLYKYAVRPLSTRYYNHIERERQSLCCCLTFSS